MASAPPRRPARLTRRRAAGLLALGGAAFGLLAACGGAAGGRLTTAAGAGADAPAKAPTAAPDFTFTTFEGERLGLADLRGKAVVLNFWASWCVPCKAEMPYFETTYRAYKDRGVVFVGLAVQDDPDDSALFLDQLGITYPTGPDVGNEVALSYRATGLPTTVFITRDGKVARKWTGALSERQLVAYVEEIAR